MTLACAQCGAEIRIEETSGFVRCPFCRATLVLDASGVRPHFLYRPRVGLPQVLPILRRWSDDAALPAPRLAGAPRVTLYPFWRYPTAARPMLIPAWSTVEAWPHAVRAPEAEQALYEPTDVPDAQVVEPDVGEAAARARAQSERAGVLVHVPFLEAAVEIAGRRGVATIDACSGSVTVAGPVGPAARRSGRAGVPALVLALMVGAGAALRGLWPAAMTVAALGALLSWLLAAGLRGADPQGGR